MFPITADTVVNIAFLVTVVLPFYLHWNPAPYGKFTKDGGVFCGAKMNAKLGWMIQECPAFFITLYHLDFSLPLPIMMPLCLFTAHYFNRSFIFPFLMTSTNPTPIETVASAFGFCTFNGFIQVTYLFRLQSPDNALSVIQILGVLIFVCGSFINISADSHLRELAARRVGKQYLTPTKGFFKLVSAANYFGEIVEWWGYAAVAQTRAALWFAVFTSVFLGQRGCQAHSYYLSKIEDYPRGRRAVIPYLI